MRTVLFLASHLALVLFGAWAWRFDEVRSMGWTARIAVAFGAGAIGLTVWATLLSLLRIRWSIFILAAPLIVLSAIVLSVRRISLHSTRSRLGAAGLFLLVIAFLASLHLGLMLWTSRSTSVDFLFFWGVKAVRFAEAGGIDPELLKWQLFQHAVPEYPPLVPVVQAWAVMVSGGMPWVTGPLATLIWFVAVVPVALEQLRRLIPSGGAAMAMSFWAAALSLSLGSSYSGANAEAPLLFFVTLAALGIVIGDSKPYLASLFLAGAVLTKVEGLAAAILLVLGMLLRTWMETGRFNIKNAAIVIAAPAIALLLWFSFQFIHGMEIGYKSHGPLLRLYSTHVDSVLNAFWRNLHAGSHWLAWLFSLVFLTRLRRNTVVRLMPLLLAITGLLGFFFFDYLHDPSDPTERIGWTLPRISQPALSMLILAAGIVSFDTTDKRQSAAVQNER